MPRSVLYLQGILLGVVALAAFALGVQIGGGVGQPGGDSDASGPQEISGTVLAAFGDGAARPDEGCVIMAFPEDVRPSVNERASAEGLRPGDPLPGGGDSRLLAVAAMGGAYARADEKGEYRLQVPGAGGYFVLFVSRSVRRGSDEAMNRTDLAQLGRYVAPATELLGDRKYVWRRIRLAEGRSLDIRF